MGLTLQFAIGEKQTIIDSVERADFDFLYQLESENRIADFSLHIMPNDLNFLVNSATELKHITVFGLREYLDTTNFYFDSEDGGAYFVDTAITSLFAKFNESDAPGLTYKWFGKLTVEYNEDIVVNDDAIDAVRKLILISKQAQEQHLDLIHIWFP
ncbi:MAG TPA: hypothetical protein VK518_23820 [Puia sp.]|nr:hypothetical protein [Puia sp.]